MEAWRGAWGSPPTALAGKYGTRAFPWRVVMMAGNLGELYANDLVLALSEPMQGDFSWVRPGQVAWDWWNHWGLEGTPFPAGVNTETYCAYIDFAADFGVEYVILDEGWAQNLDVTRSVPEIDLPAILAHASSSAEKPPTSSPSSKASPAETSPPAPTNSPAPSKPP